MEHHQAYLAFDTQSGLYSCPELDIPHQFLICQTVGEVKQQVTKQYPAAMPVTPDKVVLHPLVLLSVVDHYNRVAKDTRKRVIGVLLGEVSKGVIDVSNSFAGMSLLQAMLALKTALRARPSFAQCPSRRMTMIPASGSWTIPIWRLCSRCSRK